MRGTKRKRRKTRKMKDERWKKQIFGEEKDKRMDKKCKMKVDERQ